MTKSITTDLLISACGDNSEKGAIVYDTELEPLAGRFTPVNPAIYPQARYQTDMRWESLDAANPTPVIVIDNVPSQANRLEAALADTADTTRLPVLQLDLDVPDLAHLPPHLPSKLSSLRWPHRNADSYLRDSMSDDQAFISTPLGKSLIDATADTAAALVAWFPQALLFGFWQSHLGKKRSQAKHARAWVSEIIGWNPASDSDLTRSLGVKGDPINIGDVGKVTFNDDDQTAGWEVAPGTKAVDKTKMSSIGHGQVPFKTGEESLAAVSFQRITQRASLSFAQLRRVKLGDGSTPEQNATARALVAALGLHAHHHAFGRPFALRSGTDLAATRTNVRLDDEPVTVNGTAALVSSTLAAASDCGVSTDGWGQPTVVLTPNKSLINAIRATWPDLDAAPEA